LTVYIRKRKNQKEKFEGERKNKVQEILSLFAGPQSVAKVNAKKVAVTKVKFSEARREVKVTVSNQTR
jgi:hypothetical protein